VASRPPAWRPPPAALKVESGRVPVHVLAYADREGEIRTIDAETGGRLPATPGDAERLSSPPTGEPAKRATSPDGRSLATLRHAGRRDELVVDRRGEGGARVLFSARRALTGPTWSPDGRWLLVGWPEADQWLFIPAERRGRLVAIDRISEQFDPGGNGGVRFPRVAGWIQPQR
jgi:hypothetical protein